MNSAQKFFIYFLISLSCFTPLFCGKQYVSPDQVKGMCFKLTTVIKEDSFKPDLLIGLARGGLIPMAYLSSDIMLKQRNVFSLGVKSYDDMKQGDIELTSPLDIKHIQQFKNILIVDDIVDTGKTIEFVTEILKKSLSDESKIKVAALFYKPKNSKIKPDYYVEETEEWIVFPWE